MYGNTERISTPNFRKAQSLVRQLEATPVARAKDIPAAPTVQQELIRLVICPHLDP